MRKKHLRILLCWLITIIFIQYSHAGDKGLLLIKGNVKGTNNKSLAKGQVFITAYNSVSLEKIHAAGTFSNSGGFSINTNNKLPQYIHFVSPGKITCSILLPVTQKKILNIDIILQDYEEGKDTVIFGGSVGGAIVKTDDSNINQWIKVKSMADYEPWHEVLNEIHYKVKNGTAEGFKYGLSAYYNSMLEAYRGTTDRELKNYVLLNLATLCIGDKFTVEKKYLLEVIRETAPDNILWFADGGSGMFFRGCFIGLGGFKEENPVLENFIDSLIEKIRLKANVPFILAEILFIEKSKTSSQFKKYYSILVNEYPESKQAANVKRQLGDNLRISAGKYLPDFSIANIDKPGTVINKSQLKSKLTLIDFWATWCGPCIKQLSNIEKVYAIYKDKGLEVLSVSIDQKIDAAETFRKKRYKMPWLNGFSGIDSIIRDRFEVFAIPKMILIDDKGKILSVSRNELEDGGLEQTVLKYLNNKN